MNVAIRAHRILKAIPNYRKTENQEDWPSRLWVKEVGAPAGYYRNSDSQDDAIGIFAEGLAWFENDHLVAIRFVDIDEITLPAGKESEGLLVKVRDGRQLWLPIKGQRGRFLDSMEMLRFLDRVLEDLRGQGQMKYAE